MHSNTKHEKMPKDVKRTASMTLGEACRMAVTDAALLQKIKFSRSPHGIRVTGRAPAVALFFWRHLDLFKMATPMSDTRSKEVQMELMPMPSAHAKVLTGHLIVRLMRVYGKTIRGLAHDMALPVARVQQVRRDGVSGAALVHDWLTAIAQQRERYETPARVAISAPEHGTLHAGGMTPEGRPTIR